MKLALKSPGFYYKRLKIFHHKTLTAACARTSATNTTTITTTTFMLNIKALHYIRIA